MQSILQAFLSETGGDGAPQQQPGAGGGLLGGPFVLIAAMFAIFYFIVLRPQSKERKRQAEWLASIKKGDEVVTQSGIIGTVVLVEDRSVTLDVGGGNKIRVLKSTVMSAWKQSEPAGPAKAEARK
jgi:preprotein translocase subunit YajC